MSDKPPYMQTYSNITKGLQKIQEAATPPRFTQDFLETKLAMKGGSARPFIPFLKRTGFIGSDGVPTELYKRFRNPAQRGTAAAQALRNGYSALYEVNEYVHDASEKDLKGVVVQVTGLDANASVVKSIVGSFNALKEFATFDGDELSYEPDAEVEQTGTDDEEPMKSQKATARPTLGLSYTINLNLPPTSDIAVFNAIFKSLKENLLK
jgi:hypothetical protein